MTDYFDGAALMVASHTLIRGSQFNNFVQAVDDAFAMVPNLTAFIGGNLRRNF